MLRPFSNASIRRAAVFTLLFALCVLVPAGTYGATGDVDEAPIVTAIEFAPTQYLSNEDMLSAMTEVQIGQPFDADALMEDLWAIHSLGVDRHNEQVFFDFEAELVPHGDGVKILVYPIEMPVIQGFAVDIDVVDEETFLKQFDLQPGTLLSIDALHAAIDKARDGLFNDTGQFFYLTDLAMDEGDIVHIQLRSVRIASIKVVGNEKTRQYVIDREIESKIGEPLSVHKVNDDVRRIFHLRLFDDVEADLAERADNPLEVDIIYQVLERKTGMAGFGAGYSSVDKFVGYLELADENLFGRGQYGSVRWEFGGTKSSYDLSFYEPNVAGTRISTGFGLYNRTLKRVDEGHTEHSVGGNITVGKRFTDFLQASMRLKVENVTITDDDGTKRAPDRTRSIRLGFTADTTDRPFYPTLGMRYGASTEVAGQFLGGDTSFIKYEGDWSTYHKVGSNDQVVALRIMGGISPGELPSQEKFRVGGPDSVRSYDYGKWRGEAMLVSNAEYRFKISENVQGVVFADAGRAWNHDDEIKLADLKAAVGLGVRFETPLGMMRLDYGLGKEGGKVFFSIGPSF